MIITVIASPGEIGARQSQKLSKYMIEIAASLRSSQ